MFAAVNVMRRTATENANNNVQVLPLGYTKTNLDVVVANDFTDDDRDDYYDIDDKKKVTASDLKA